MTDSGYDRGQQGGRVKAIRAAGPGADPFETIEDEVLFELEVYFIPSREIVYQVQAVARTAGGGVFVREAVIELALQPDQPFQAHVWRRGELR